MHSKVASEFPSHRYHSGSNNHKLATFLHASSTTHSHFCQVLLVDGIGPETGLWLMHPQQGMAVLHNMHHSPFPGEGKELAIHIRWQGFTKEQDWENPPEASNAIFPTIWKCSHLWERPIDSSSEQVWWIRGTVDKGLFYTRCDESATLAPAPQRVHSLHVMFSNKIPFVLFPLLPLLLGRAPNNHLQSDFIVCLQTSLQSLPNRHANKQLVIT